MAEAEVSSQVIRAADGWGLDVLELVPPREPTAVVVVGHAMMVDRRTIYRPEQPCLASTLREEGFLVLVPDLRGHGASGPTPQEGGQWTYDELVADVGLYLAHARRLARGKPVVLVGHSLFGHNALAYLGRHAPREVAALVLLGVDVWLAACEAQPARWALKAAILGLASPIVRAVGRAPIRRLSLGSADESLDYWRWFWRLVRERGWYSADGWDYLASLSKIATPTLHVVSDGDRLLGRPSSALRFSRALPSREVVHLPRYPAELSAVQAPSHMGLVTDPAQLPVWRWIAGWIRGHCQKRFSDPGR